MLKPKLTIVTGNPLKFRELSAKLGEFFECEQGRLDHYHEIQGTSEQILSHKLKASYEAFKQPVLVDDTSVHFDDLNGFPGPYIRGFLEHLTPYEMGMKFKGSRIAVTCWLGVQLNNENIVLASGTITGDVVEPIVKDPGDREFDVFIQIDGTDRPMYQFTPEEKNKHSHRGRALDDLLKKLNIQKIAE